MRCRSCEQPAGWLRRMCSDCKCLETLWTTHRGVAPKRLMQAFADTGIDHQRIQRFLDSERGGGEGSVRDQIAADMANQLLEAFGQRERPDAGQIKRLRERGAWRHMDRKPESDGL